MRVSVSSTSLMTLKDYNLTHFLGALLFFAMGLGVFLMSLPSGEPLPIGIGALFALIGLGILVTTKLVSIKLDKGAGKASFSLWSILKRESREVEIHRIKGITLEKEYLQSSKGETRRQFVIKFSLEGGEQLPFEFGTLSGTMDVLTNPEEGIRSKAKEVAGFLGLPYNEVNPPSPADALSAIKDAMTSAMEKKKTDSLR